MAELCRAIVSVAIGAAAFRQLTFGVMSLGPALAHEAVVFAARRTLMPSCNLPSRLSPLTVVDGGE